MSYKSFAKRVSPLTHQSKFTEPQTKLVTKDLKPGDRIKWYNRLTGRWVFGIFTRYGNGHSWDHPAHIWAIWDTLPREGFIDPANNQIELA